MASMLNTTAHLEHVTTIPSGIPASKATELLQNHEFYISCNPHMVAYEPTETPSPPPTIPSDRHVCGTSPATCYKVTDRVHALPAGLWDSDVESTYEFINTEKGVFVRIRSPLSVVMESAWGVRKTESGDYELVEDVVIKCSRVLVGVIKSTCEAGWPQIHENMINQLKEQVT